MVAKNPENHVHDKNPAAELAEAMFDLRLTDIIESLPVGFLICDSDDCVLACNSLYKAWFFPDHGNIVVPGLAYADLLRAFVASGLSVDGCDDPEWIEKRLHCHSNPGEPFRHRLQDGRILRTVESRTSDGCIISVHTDITELDRQRVAAQQKSDELQVVLESIDQGVSMVDNDLNAVAFNQHFMDLLEFPEKLGQPGTPFAEFVRHNAERGEYGEGEIETLVQERVELASRFEPHRFERTRPDGTIMEIVGKPIPNGGIVTTYTDITERKKAEEAVLARDRELTEQNQRFNAALDNMSQGLSMFDKDRRLLVCNRRYLEIYKLPAQFALPGTRHQDIVQLLLERGDYAGEHPETLLEGRLAMIVRNEPASKIQSLSDGRSIAVVHQPMANGGWVATHEDVTELQRVQALVAHMAHHDDLTGLPNRTLLRERMEQVVCKRNSQQPFAILCIDLDRFKNVNDTIGHPMGDKLLQAAAERLTNCVRETDTIARLGGDEFAVLQVSGHQPKAATVTAARICDVLSQPFDLDGHQVVVGASVGIAIAPENGADTDVLLKNADLALYRAKDEGRGIYRSFETDMDTKIQARRSLEEELRAAFERNEFELHYQPLVSLTDNEITGFEALLRWSHPKRGFVSPADFIPVTEEIGLIMPLGEWIINQACLDAARWPSHIRVAVNLSPVQFHGGNLVQTVFNALASSRLSAQRLELEITERVLLQHSETTIETLHALRDMGVRIAMDDFGTGYSSLSYLRSFPFDKIKIDRSFINDLSEQEEAAIIVNAVASLSQNLGMTATAEGVETEIQRTRVRAAGYTEMQGFLFSPARPATDIHDTFFAEAKGTGTA
ncbi:MAG: PAS-domain containing protein [Alphaproteobacteria bacterium]|nr:PAS-domain containing protein [Alphaproteobacteria bacterium]